MPIVQPAPHFWKNRRVLVTGHTGFIGSWLTATLVTLGAKVTGIALHPQNPSHYRLLEKKLPITSLETDICQRQETAKAITDAAPEIVFHLAAQSLVREAYASPAETFAVNTLGTVNILEILRGIPTTKATLLMTTDKVYGNHESPVPHNENDRLGGIEPYGSSKACAEIAAEAYRASYFVQLGKALATVRAGNIIGGGDFSANRLMPDFVKAAQTGKALSLRHPDATRPWQFVMEPIRACLILAERMYEQSKDFSEAWNIGPDSADNVSVRDLIAGIHKAWGKSAPAIDIHPEPFAPYESKMLAIDSSKIRDKTGWKPVQSFARGLEATADWYKAYMGNADPTTLTFRHIEEWLNAS